MNKNKIIHQILRYLQPGIKLAFFNVDFNLQITPVQF